MAHAHSLRVVFLGSGSSGNAAAITDGTTTVLVDCGFSAREVAQRLSTANISPRSVCAVLVTHEHVDHVRGVGVFARRHATQCAVLATAGTRSRAALDTGAMCVEVVRAGKPTRVGTLDVLPFSTSHDAAEPVGFRIDSCGSAIGIATDTGVLTDEAAEALQGVDILCLESNHDVGMLEHGPYPAFLKRRIRSHAGHLSNADAADALSRLASDRLVAVFALHRSRTNNTAELAAAALRVRAQELGLGVPIVVASQHGVCDSHPPQGSLFPEAATRE